MILRIMEEGQLELPEDDLDELNELDDVLVAAVEAGDEAAFGDALSALHARVRELCTPVPEDYLGPSELVLPPVGSTLAEVRDLLSDEGLIPG